MSVLEELHQQHEALMGGIANLPEIFRPNTGSCGELRWDCRVIANARAPHRRAAKKIRLLGFVRSVVGRQPLRVRAIDVNGLAVKWRSPPTDEAFVVRFELAEFLIKLFRPGDVRIVWQSRARVINPSPSYSSGV